MKHFFLTLAALWVSIHSSAEVILAPLKEVRDRLVLPPYTSKDRQILANQSALILGQLFVHRDIKKKDFGAAADPVPHLKLLQEKATELTNKEFHEKIRSLFINLHDFHTNYSAPRPLACGAAFIPVRFASVRDGAKDKIVATGKSAAAAELVKKIEFSDELISIDGISVEKVVEGMLATSGAANADAMRTRSIQLLSMRNLASSPMPEKDVVKYALKGASGTYEVDIPWMSLSDDECLVGTPAKPKAETLEPLKLSVDEYQERFNRVFGDPGFLVTNALDEGKPNPLSEVFEAALLETPAGQIGYIRLKSFSWKDRRLDLGTIVEGFRRTVEAELSPAMGLVIDVRGNPGGHIVLAEKMVQLFSRRVVKPTKVRMLANALNEKIFTEANGGDNRWSDAVKTAMKKGAYYTEPMPITPVPEANSLGQIWFRPVVVLTDSTCYSACDLFAAGMQDSEAATIIGIDRNTGGGGANVMEYRTFQAILADWTESPFVSLPFQQNMRVSWRQTVRSGKNEGQLLEGKGVQSDIVVPLKLEDVGSESKELMKAVHKVMDGLQSKYLSGLGGKRGGSVLLANGKAAKWMESVYGIDAIEVHLGGRSPFEIEVPYSKTPKPVEISLEALEADWTDRRVLLVGKKAGEPLFRVVRELKWRGDYVEIPKEGLLVDFSDGETKPFHLVLLKSGKATGWQLVGEKLRIGKGPNYESNVLARAFLPIKLAGKGGKLLIDFSVLAEDQNDSLRIFLLNPDTGERLNLFAGSKMPVRRSAVVALPTEWLKADVVFEFESDENWNLVGPALYRVGVIQN